MAKELDLGIREGTCGGRATLRWRPHPEAWWPCSLAKGHDGPHEAYNHDDQLLAHWPVDVANYVFEVTAR